MNKFFWNRKEESYEDLSGNILLSYRAITQKPLGNLLLGVKLLHKPVSPSFISVFVYGSFFLLFVDCFAPMNSLAFFYFKFNISGRKCISLYNVYFIVTINYFVSLIQISMSLI